MFSDSSFLRVDVPKSSRRFSSSFFSLTFLFVYFFFFQPVQPYRNHCCKPKQSPLPSPSNPTPPMRSGGSSSCCCATNLLREPPPSRPNAAPLHRPIETRSAQIKGGVGGVGGWGEQPLHKRHLAHIRTSRSRAADILLPCGNFSGNAGQALAKASLKPLVLIQCQASASPLPP